MRKLILLILIFVLMLTMFTSCYDAREIDDWAYVYTVGVDKGVENSLRFTFQMPIMKLGVGGGGGGQSTGAGGQQGGGKPYDTVSIDGPTFYSAVDLADTARSREMNFMHTKYLVIGEDLAREGVERFINGMIRSRQIRRIMYIIVVRGKASEFIEQFSPVLTSAISKAQEGFMLTDAESGLFVETLYQDFIKNIKTTYRMPAAPLVSLNDFSSYKASGTPPEEFKSEGDYLAGEIPRKGGNKFEFLGTALFDGDKMVGELNGDETRGLLIIRGELERASIAIPDPKNKKLRISIRTSQKKNPEVKVDFQEGKPVVKVKVFLEGDILNLQSPVEYESVKMKPVLEDAFATYIKGILDKTIEKCKNLKVDTFGFGEKAVRHFLTIQEWESFNWLGRFKDAEVSTEVSFVIRRTGTLLKTNPTRNSEGVRP